MKAPAAAKPKKDPDLTDLIPAPYLQMAAARMVSLGKKVFENQPPESVSPPVAPSQSS